MQKWCSLRLLSPSRSRHRSTNRTNVDWMAAVLEQRKVREAMNTVHRREEDMETLIEQGLVNESAREPVRLVRADGPMVPEGQVRMERGGPVTGTETAKGTR